MSPKVRNLLVAYCGCQKPQGAVLRTCDGENGVLLLGYYEEVKMGKKEEGEGEGEHLFMERGALRLIT